MNIKSTGLHVGVATVSADRTLREMQQLETMAAKLLETARKLPAGPVRNDLLKEIGKFRVRIAALKAKGKGPALVRTDVEVLPGSGIVGMAQSPQPYDLVTRPCTIHAGRFRWDIRENGTPVQSFHGIVRHRAGSSRGRSP